MITNILDNTLSVNNVNNSESLYLNASGTELMIDLVIDAIAGAYEKINEKIENIDGTIKDVDKTVSEKIGNLPKLSIKSGDNNIDLYDPSKASDSKEFSIQTRFKIDNNTIELQVSNDNGDNFHSVASFDTTKIIKDKFLSKVEIANGTGENVDKVCLIFTFNDENNSTIEVPLESIFDNGILTDNQIIISRFKIGDTYFSIDDTEKLNKAIEYISKEITENIELIRTLNLKIDALTKRLDNFKSISPKEIYKMFGMTDEQINDDILNRLKDDKTRNVTLVNDIDLTSVLNINKDLNLSLDENTISNTKNSHTIKVASGKKVNINGGSIIGSFGASDDTAVIVTTGNASLTLDDVYVEGIHPVWIRQTENSKGEATVEIQSGAFVGIGPEAVYVSSISPNAGGSIKIYDGYFDSKDTEYMIEAYKDDNDNPRMHHKFLLNIYDGYRKTKTDYQDIIKVYGGIFKNFDPSDNVSEGPGTNYVDKNSYCGILDKEDNSHVSDIYVVRPKKSVNIRTEEFYEDGKLYQIQYWNELFLDENNNFVKKKVYIENTCTKHN